MKLPCCVPVAKAGDIWHTCRGKFNQRLSPPEKAQYRKHPAGTNRTPARPIDFMSEPDVQRRMHLIENPWGCRDLTCAWCGADEWAEP